jgi:hypothetical protein
MAVVKRPFGKDSPERFIDGALTGGGSGPSNEIVDKKVDRPDQSIKTAFAMDNVKLAYKEPTSIKDESGFAGGISNLKHSLTGTGAVNEEVGAAGPVKHTIFPNH